jgi:hypothetical protein
MNHVIFKLLSATSVLYSLSVSPWFPLFYHRDHKVLYKDHGGCIHADSQ